jgi:hypothetical protein
MIKFGILGHLLALILVNLASLPLPYEERSYTINIKAECIVARNADSHCRLITPFPCFDKSTPVPHDSQVLYFLTRGERYQNVRFADLGLLFVDCVDSHYSQHKHTSASNNNDWNMERHTIRMVGGRDKDGWYNNIN